MQTNLHGHTVDYTLQGTGPPILMIPGTIGDQQIFCKILPQFTTEFSVYCINIPAVKSIPRVTRVLHDFITKVISGKTGLLGTSVGGWIAQHYAQRYPQNVNFLILSSTFSDNKLLRKRYLLLHRISRFLPWLLIRSVFFSQFHSWPPFDYHADFFVRYAQKNLQRLEKPGVRSRISLSLDSSTPPQVEENLPTLIIYAADDPVLSRNSYTQLIETYPQAMVSILDDGGHFPYIFNTTIYVEKITEFLSSIDQSAG